MSRSPIPRLKQRTRFRMYLAGAVAAPASAYAADKGWIGLAEVALVGSYIALLNLLAAANVSTSQPDEPPRRQS